MKEGGLRVWTPALTMNRAVAMLCSGLLAVAAGCSSTGQPTANADAAKSTCSVPDNQGQLLVDVLVLVNRAREREGLAPLNPSPSLDDLADDFACQMIEDGFFAHEHPKTHETAGERLTAAGYVYYAMGENLAVGQTSAEEVVADWMASPGHRENILAADWREIGLAVRTGGQFGWYWVQEFADPVEIGE